MPRRKITTRWQKKQPRASIVNPPPRPTHGLSPVASWLDPSKPYEILDDLRDYQERWCNHVFSPMAIVRRKDYVIETFFCEECGVVLSRNKAA